MTLRQVKNGYLVLTAMNTLAACYFFNYLFFFLHDRFGFGNRGNLWVSALYGFLYIFSAWQGGKFARRRGSLTSLRVGFCGLLVLLVLGALLDSVAGIICVLIGYTVALLFTWPALEALVSENESRAGMQHMVGIYNCTWSAAAALSYFTGGPLYDWLGRGAVFWVPAGIVFCQLLLLNRLAREAANLGGKTVEPAAAAPPNPEPAAFRQAVTPQTFLKMAWLANPFAYMAMNTLIAVMPGIAQKFALSATQVGLFCSVWLFGRFAAFAFLWRWPGWHYRFRWLCASFLVLIASFTALLLAGQLWLVILAQVFLGLAAGLIYYSSLFYSMDVGEASAEHGGLHEAAIGAGMFAGPVVGAAALQFLPGHPHASVLAVSALLLLGLAGLLGIWAAARFRSKKAAA